MNRVDLDDVIRALDVRLNALRHAAYSGLRRDPTLRQRHSRPSEEQIELRGIAYASRQWLGITLMALTALCLPWRPAKAALVTVSYDFTLGDFVTVAGSAPPPISTLSGSFTVTFDTTVTVVDTMDGLIVHSLSFTPGSPLAFSYDASLKRAGFGGAQNTATFTGLGTDDFGLVLDLTNLDAPVLLSCADPGFFCGTAAGNPAVLTSAYTMAAVPDGAWFATSIGSRITLVPVPEPATWVLLGIGLSAIFACRRAAGAAIAGKPAGA